MQAAFSAVTRGLASLAHRWPEWHLELRSEQRSLRIRVGAGAQMAGLATTVLVAGFVGLGSAKLVADEAREDEATRAQVARMAAQVEALKAGTAALEGQVRSTVERIEARQRFLDALLTGKARGRELAELIPPAGRARVSGDAAREAGVLAPFARLEAQQLALVDKAAATAETRLKDLQALLRRLGLDQERFLALSMPRIGVGGPFVPAAAVGPDPRFAELYVSWQRLEQLEEALASIPAFLPVERFTLTSGFGFRFDPFSGTGAQHLGVDLAGAHGEPIRAAAAGTVVRAERFGAYGLTVDVDHGRGFLTRYAHLSRIDVRLGDRVAMGQRIGAMGSTGRSTGTHLHYEIRVDGRPVNPRPFLDSSRYILAAQGSDPGL